VPSQFNDSPEFQRLLRGEEQPSLVNIALEIARDAYPELNSQRYLDELAGIAERVRGRCEGGSRPQKILGQINWVLFVEERYEGDRDNYFDPRNSYLNEVIDRKKGIPISLSILYGNVAERLGVVLHGANLPAHFMLLLHESPEPLFVDPFQAGELLDRARCIQRLSGLTGHPVELTEEHLTPCSPSVIVARMLRNLKSIYLGMHDYLSALPVQRRLVAVARDEPDEQRDLGLICLQIDRPGEAIDPLQAYLTARPNAEDAQKVADLLKTARRIVARWN
jgi:regulator of sirC expression with transglutaminase-like and TPR domain